MPLNSSGRTKLEAVAFTKSTFINGGISSKSSRVNLNGGLCVLTTHTPYISLTVAYIFVLDVT